MLKRVNIYRLFVCLMLGAVLFPLDAEEAVQTGAVQTETVQLETAQIEAVQAEAVPETGRIVRSAAAFDENGTRSTFLQDISIRVGHGVFLPGKGDGLGLHALAGVSLGLSKRFELDIETVVRLVPDPGSDIAAGFEIGYSLLGERVSERNNVGSNLNMVLSLGFFAANYGESGRFVPTYLTLRITPLTRGTPYKGSRQHLLPVGIAWNFRNNSLSCFLSLLMYDHYIKGSWRDIYK